MCIIALCTKNKLNSQQIQLCWRNNPDGAGIAYSLYGSHHLSKGYMILPEFMEAYSKVNILPHTVHFRVASSGLVIPTLTHPFICTNDLKLHSHLEWSGTESLLFHNGIVKGWEMMARLFSIDPNNKQWSDTRLLSLILSYPRYSFKEIIRPELSGRYIYLKNGEFFMHGKFEEEQGTFFSNTGYKEYLYEHYIMVTPKGDRKHCRRKKSKNLYDYRNGTAQSNLAILP